MEAEIARLREENAEKDGELDEMENNLQMALESISACVLSARA